MLKKHLLTFAIGLVWIPIIILLTFQANFNYKNILDATFVVGIVFFAIGLIIVTGAGKVFRGIGFLAKKLVGRKYQNYTYFDYVSEQNEVKQPKSSSGATIFTTGSILMVVSLILSYMYIYQ